MYIRFIIFSLCRRRLWRYTEVFSGAALVDWLLQQSIVADRAQGCEYGSHLVLGRVISHLQGREPFIDKPDVWFTFAVSN